jgi:hypothetical protein
MDRVDEHAAQWLQIRRNGSPIPVALAVQMVWEEQADPADFAISLGNSQLHEVHRGSPNNASSAEPESRSLLTHPAGIQVKNDD